MSEEKTIHHAHTHAESEANPTYMLAFSLILMGALISASIYFSINSLNETLMAKNFAITINTPANAAAQTPSTAGAGGSPAAAPSPAPVPTPSPSAAPSGCGTAPSAAPSGGPSPTVSVDISGLPPKGSPSAKVTLVEFSDYLCPFAKRAETSDAQILAAFAGKVNIVHMNYIIHGTPAHQAAEAAECAGAQGKFWEMHDSIFTDQKVDVASLKAKAAAIPGIDTAKFDTCLDTGAMAARVDAQNAAGSKIGVGGTPSFVIGTKSGNSVIGQMTVGALPFDDYASGGQTNPGFKTIVTAALAKAG